MSAPLPVPMQERFEFGDFVLDGARASLSRGGTELALRPKSFDLLHYLVVHADRLLSKDELLGALWPKVVVTEDSLTRCISEVREALGDRAQSTIRTVPKRGYRFVLPVRRHPAEAVDGSAQAQPAQKTNLPDGLLAPIGRDTELAALDALLQQRRLVTLTGPGGVGKSRLARWLLHRQRGAFEHGVAWVDLSALNDGALLPGSVANALGLHIGGGDAMKGLLAAIAPLRLLVALDNAEHLAEDVARLAEALHDGAAGLKLLVTSQTPLKLAAEAVVRLDPLATPPRAVGVDEALRYGAVALLAQRARSADARFELTERNVAAAIEVCRRLDGLPLAIELAAARVPLFGLPKLLEVLDERFNALTVGLRGQPSRHKTLRAAMQWSHSLLDEREQAVFRRLGVFAHGFSLERAQQVLAVAPGEAESIASDDTAALDRWAVTDVLGALVERSLVAVDGLDVPRYRLLETPRAFALECLEASGEKPALQRAHAAAYRLALEKACADLFERAPPVDAWREACMADLDDARAAWNWSLLHDAESAVSLAASLAFVLASEWPQDRRRVLTVTQPLVAESMPAALRARWVVQAAFDLGAAQPAQAHALALQAVALHRELGDRLGLYRSLSILLYCHPAAPEDDQLREMNELREIEKQNPDWPAMVRADGGHALACWYSARGEFETAIEHRQRSLKLQQRAGYTWRGMVAQANLMDSQIAAGRLDEAIACGSALEAQLRGTRQLAGLPSVRLNLTAALLSKGEVAQSRALAVDGWQQALQLEWQPYWADYLALLCALEGRVRAASRLLGYAEAGYNRKESDREVNEARAVQRAEALARERLTSEEFARLKQSGETLADEDVAELAFALQDAS